MDSIGQEISEYLVNFDSLIKIMEEYNFKPVRCKSKVLRESIGNFQTILDELDERKTDNHFMNNYQKGILK